MSKPTYTQAELTLRQANIRTGKTILGILFWIAMGAVPAWHFATEHAELETYKSQDQVKQVAMASLVPQPIPAMDVIARAARSSK